MFVSKRSAELGLSLIRRNIEAFRTASAGRVVHASLRTPLRARYPPARSFTEKIPSTHPTYSNTLMFLIGCTGGCTGAIMGLGGGVVLVPLLTAMAKMPQKSAIGTSLVAALVVGSVGAANYGREGHVDLINALVIAIGSSMTASFGARFAQGLPDKKLKFVLGLYMLTMAAVVPARDMFLKDLWQSRKSPSTSGSVESTVGGTALTIDEIAKHGVFLVTGWFAGFASGLFGIAGGTIVTPTLAVVTDLTQPQVVGTSLAAGLVPSILAARSFHKGGHVVMTVIPAIAAGAATGAVLGSNLALLLSDEQLRAVFGGGMLALGIRVLVTAAR